MISIGFTGTQHGAIPKQLIELRNAIVLYSEINGNPSIARHGMCKGADVQFHNIIRELFPPCKIIGHPGFELGYSFRIELDCDEILPVPLPGGLKPPIQRNHNIVDNVNVMFATPKEDKEILRSGTWATIRYARSVGKKPFIIYPTKRPEFDWYSENDQYDIVYPGGR